MEIEVVRKWCGDGCSVGELSIDGQFECFTLEDRERLEKVYGETAIPTGRYQVGITHSPHFGRALPLLYKVPNFEGVRIHPGNTAADTEGCILVGQTRGPDSIGKSRFAFDALFPKLQAALDRQEKIWITVCDA